MTPRRPHGALSQTFVLIFAGTCLLKVAQRQQGGNRLMIRPRTSLAKGSLRLNGCGISMLRGGQNNKSSAHEITLNPSTPLRTSQDHEITLNSSTPLRTSQDHEITLNSSTSRRTSHCQVEVERKSVAGSVLSSKYPQKRKHFNNISSSSNSSAETQRRKIMSEVPLVYAPQIGKVKRTDRIGMPSSGDLSDSYTYDKQDDAGPVVEPLANCIAKPEDYPGYRKNGQQSVDTFDSNNGDFPHPGIPRHRRNQVRDWIRHMVSQRDMLDMKESALRSAASKEFNVDFVNNDNGRAWFEKALEAELYRIIRKESKISRKEAKKIISDEENMASEMGREIETEKHRRHSYEAEKSDSEIFEPEGSGPLPNLDHIR
ncbi:hypothetical protein AAMO2058_000912900 [Amorphochlora amoebiformis]